MSDIPAPVVNRYLTAASTGNIAALADCFTPDGVVVDEGHTYRGHEQIIGWRKDLAGKWTFTSTVTGSQPIGPDEYQVSVRVEGNFPGAVANLIYRFTLTDDLVKELSIG
jgi:hypothetical protein